MVETCFDKDGLVTWLQWTIFGIFNELENVSLACFDRNVEWDFFVIFKHCDRSCIKNVHIPIAAQNI